MASLVFRCRRCGHAVTEDCASPDVEIRRRIENGETFTIHECAPATLGDGVRGGGALGVCELLGEGERPAPETDGAA